MEKEGPTFRRFRSGSLFFISCTAVRTAPYASRALVLCSCSPAASCCLPGAGVDSNAPPPSPHAPPSRFRASGSDAAPRRPLATALPRLLPDAYARAAAAAGSAPAAFVTQPNWVNAAGSPAYDPFRCEPDGANLLINNTGGKVAYGLRVTGRAAAPNSPKPQRPSGTY